MKEYENLIVIKVCEEFSCSPGGFNDGIKFYKEVLKPAFEKALEGNKKIIIDFDGGYGYLGSFLEACFGCLKKEYGPELISYYCEFKSDELIRLSDDIKEIIERM